MNREVWSANEAFVSIWELDGSGNVISPALIPEAFFGRTISGRPIRLNSAIREPGCGYEQNVSRIIGHEVKIGQLFSKLATEVSPFEDSTKKWRVLLQLINPAYSGVAPFENDTADYRGCVVTDGPGWTYSDDGQSIVETDLVFRAERKA